MLEPTLYIRLCNEIQGHGHRINQNLRRAGADRTQELLGLGEQLFDRRLIGAVRGQRLHRRTDRLDRRPCRHALVGRQVVPNNYVLRVQGRQQYLFHIGLEGLLVRRAVEGKRRHHPRQAQTNEQRQVVPTSGGRSRHTLSRRRPAMRACHRRCHAGFIDKNQVVWVNVGHFLLEGGTLRLDFGAVPFVGMFALFLAADAVALQGAVKGRQATGHAQLLAQFRQGGIGVLADEFQQTALRVFVQFMRTAAAMWLGGNRSGLAFALLQADDDRHIDREQGSELSQRLAAALHRRHDAFTQIVGKSSHDDTSSRAGDLPKTFYPVWHAKGNRSSAPHHGAIDPWIIQEGQGAIPLSHRTNLRSKGQKGK
jgi:hypothetical protein